MPSETPMSRESAELSDKLRLASDRLMVLLDELDTAGRRIGLAQVEVQNTIASARQKASRP